MDPFTHLRIVYNSMDEIERREALARRRELPPAGPSVITRARARLAAAIYWIGARIEPTPCLPELPCAEMGA
jgi:hypothetical protein